MILRRALSQEPTPRWRIFAEQERGNREVKKLFGTMLAGALLAALVIGCAGNVAPKETRVKCPKCGATFTVDEGIKVLANQP